MWAPSSRSLAGSATSLISPRVSRAASARGTWSSGRTLVFTSMPWGRAAASVSPTEAACGSVKVTIGMAIAVQGIERRELDVDHRAADALHAAIAGIALLGGAEEKRAVLVDPDVA
jgi:hypothetical protein